MHFHLAKNVKLVKFELISGFIFEHFKKVYNPLSHFFSTSLLEVITFYSFYSFTPLAFLGIESFVLLNFALLLFSLT